MKVLESQDFFSVVVRITFLKDLALIIVTSSVSNSYSSVVPTPYLLYPLLFMKRMRLKVDIVQKGERPC